MPLSNAQKQQRYRDRLKAQEAEDVRRKRGLPPAPPPAEVPEGAYETSNGCFRPQVGWYECGNDAFARIPDAILRETYTTPDGEVRPIPEQHAKYVARKRQGEDHSSLDALFQE